MKILNFIKWWWNPIPPTYKDGHYRHYFSTIGEDGKPVIVIKKQTWSMTVSQRELPKLIEHLKRIKLSKI